MPRRFRVHHDTPPAPRTRLEELRREVARVRANPKGRRRLEEAIRAYAAGSASLSVGAERADVAVPVFGVALAEAGVMVRGGFEDPEDSRRAAEELARWLRQRRPT